MDTFKPGPRRVFGRIEFGGTKYSEGTMKLYFKPVALILAASAGCLIAYGQCVYGSADYPGSNQCRNDTCGLGCGSPTNRVQHDVCKSVAQGCCWCSWETWDCDCTFGKGHGDNATRHSWSNGICDEAGEKCHTIDDEPPVSSDPTDPNDPNL